MNVNTKNEPMHVSLIDTLAVTRGGTRLPLPASRKTRALLAYLALNPGQHRGERLCEIFWQVPDDPHGAQAGRLKAAQGQHDDTSRGDGLSDRNIDDFSFGRQVNDLEAVIEATGLERFPLLGLSQGCAVSAEYAVRYPGKVTRLILIGGYARGRNAIGNPELSRQMQAMITLVAIGWGRDQRVPFDSGRELASGVPGTRFMSLDTANHLAPETDPAWPVMLKEINDFLAE